jgi:D-cysteine desulfhydrase
MKKLNLGNFPTPIFPFPVLPSQSKVNLYIKRDDYSGVEVSGNKIRKLEYCLAECIEQGCDTVVTTGAIQSNHCRATAAASAKLNIPCHLILRGKERNEIEGNLFLDLALGAKVKFISEDTDREKYIEAYLEQLKEEGKKPYFIPIGASNAVGSNGYRDCFREILEAEKKLSINFDGIALAVGSGGSFAGLYYENKLKNENKTILGFCVCDSKEYFEKEISKILTEMKKDEGIKTDSLADETKAPNFYLNDHHIGAGYAKSTPEEIRFILGIAQKTGVLFDPCYTGKAFRGLYQEIVSGRLDTMKHILFIHTGGLMGWTRGNIKDAKTILL